MTIIYTISCDLMILQCSYMLKVLVQDLHVIRRLVNSECSLEIIALIRYTAHAALGRHDIFCIFGGEKYIFFKALYYVVYLYVMFGASVSPWSVIRCGHTERLNDRYEMYSVSVQDSHHYKDLISLNMSHVFSSYMSKKKSYPEKCDTVLSVLYFMSRSHLTFKSC
jgi:hypothetical protein